MDAPTYETFQVVGTDGVPFQFEGYVLGAASSYAPTKSRWKEITIFKTRAGKYISELAGCTQVDGEITYESAAVFNTPDALIKSLYRHDPQTHKRFLPHTDREAIATAAEADDEFRHAWQEQAKMRVVA